MFENESEASDTFDAKINHFLFQTFSFWCKNK